MTVFFRELIGQLPTDSLCGDWTLELVGFHPKVFLYSKEIIKHGPHVIFNVGYGINQ